MLSFNKFNLKELIQLLEGAFNPKRVFNLTVDGEVVEGLKLEQVLRRPDGIELLTNKGRWVLSFKKGPIQVGVRSGGFEILHRTEGGEPVRWILR